MESLKVAVLIAPINDDVTVHSHEWSREAKQILETFNYEVHDLAGRVITRSEGVAELEAHPEALYLHFDHGSPDAHWGSLTEAIIDLNNVDLLANRETYCMNCSSAKTLGKEAWKRGAKAYWGFIEPFAFTTDALDTFREFAVAGLRYRLEGNTWAKCVELVKILAGKLADALIEAGKYIAAAVLSKNASILVCYNGGEPPEEKCPVSRGIVKVFGYKTLNRLRQLRTKLSS